MKIELHLLQNFPPSNLNRDDMGEPKDAVFGGYRRARISSQSLKRSIRNAPVFREMLGDRTGKRTKRSVEVIANHLANDYGRPKEEAREVARAFASQLIGKVSDKDETDVLFYAGTEELQAIAASINSQWEDLAGPILSAVEAKKRDDAAEADIKTAARKETDKTATALAALLAPLVKTFKKDRRGRVNAVDIALFGRMLANEPMLNIDAACQIAHAISTNEVRMEFDYFTAIDDLKQENDEIGAGMIGFTGFNSSCFYRYSLVDINQLSANLGNDPQLAMEGVRAFLAATVTAIPTGKQNSFGAQTPTVLALAVAREKGPMSLANAFEHPVRPDAEQSLVQRSVARLDAHWAALNRMYPADAPGYVALVDGMGTLDKVLDTITRVDSVDELVDGVMEILGARWHPVSGAGA